MMDEFNSETDSDYTSYWRDWVGHHSFLPFSHSNIRCLPTEEAIWQWQSTEDGYFEMQRAIDKQVAGW